MAAENFGAQSFVQAFKWGWLTLVQFSTNKASQDVVFGNSTRPVRRQGNDRLAGDKGGKRKLTWQEVESKKSPDECWIVIRGKVYDVSEFGRVHPGGKVIYTHGGRDATDAFTTFHPKSAWSMLERFHVGDIVEEDEEKRTSGILEDFRQLRAEFTRRGWFDANKVFYVYKLMSNIAILASSVGVLIASGEGVWGMLLSAFLYGLFLQQCGWLAHDFLHHQVFKNRRINDAFGYLVGNVFQGFSVDWWKSKHNTHHAAPNEIDDGMGAVDPDIDTLPLLAWSADMLDTISDTKHKALISVQHYMFIPVLILARLSWAQQSLSHAFRMTKNKPGKGWLEVCLILLHYIMSGGMAFMVLSPLKAMMCLLIAQLFSGFMLGIAFVQSHNGMEVYNDTKDFVTAQVISTRDITYNPWVNWFMGGLNYQIEHHLFPTMPRHNLGKIQPFIKALCEKHGLVYEECNMVTGTKRVMKRLQDVAKQA